MTTNAMNRNVTLKGPSELGMTAYEWTNARQRMDEAMALAEWATRAFAGVGGLLRRAGNALKSSRERLVVARYPKWDLRRDLVE
jgi:hypothetical protein